MSNSVYPDETSGSMLFAKPTIMACGSERVKAKFSKSWQSVILITKRIKTLSQSEMGIAVGFVLKLRIIINCLVMPKVSKLTSSHV